MNWANAILALVMAVTTGGGGVAWYRMHAERRKILAQAGGEKAKAESTIVETSDNLVKIVNSHMDRQEQQNRELNERVAQLELQNRSLSTELALAKGYSHLLYSTMRQQGLEVATFSEYAAGGGH
jgi:hypothetical protein